MARIAGVDLPNDKRVEIGLTYIYGIGLTTSKSLGGAVVRSRARRVLREGLRQVEKERPLKVGFLIVIAARHAATTAKSTDIKLQLIEAFTKLGMFKE